jgi:hypothetical protein
MRLAVLLLVAIQRLVLMADLLQQGRLKAREMLQLRSSNEVF